MQNNELVTAITGRPDGGLAEVAAVGGVVGEARPLELVGVDDVVVEGDRSRSVDSTPPEKHHLCGSTRTSCVTIADSGDELVHRADPKSLAELP